MEIFKGFKALLFIVNLGCSAASQLPHGGSRGSRSPSALDEQEAPKPTDSGSNSQEKKDKKQVERAAGTIHEPSSGSVGASTPIPEDAVADQPQPISGMFLICEKSNKISCFLRENEERYAFKSAPVVTVTAYNSNSLPVNVTSRWLPEDAHFDVELTGDFDSIKSIKNINVKITNKEMNQSFNADFTTDPVHLGDLSSASYEGCTADSVNEVRNITPIPEYKMKFRSSAKSTYAHLVIKRTCGFGQNGRVALYLGTKIISEHIILPTFNGEVDQTYRLAPLVADTEYIVAISSGLKSATNYDHALFWSLGISY